MPRLRKLMSLILTVAAVYLAICAVAFAAQRPLLYPAPAGRREPRADGATLWKLAGPGGKPVFALHAPAPPGGTTVVHFHGNGEDLADAAWLIAELRRRGLGVLSVEYPGYGLARAQWISEAAIYAAAETALAELRRASKGGDVALLGVSLGSGVAIELAVRGHGARVALVTPYTSIPDVAAHHFGWLPVRLLLRDRFDNASKAARVAQPALVIHGTSDEVIPFALGEALAKKLPHARLVPVEGAHHNDVLSGAALDELIRFLGER